MTAAFRIETLSNLLGKVKTSKGVRGLIPKSAPVWRAAGTAAQRCAPCSSPATAARRSPRTAPAEADSSCRSVYCNLRTSGACIVHSLHDEVCACSGLADQTRPCSRTPAGQICTSVREWKISSSISLVMMRSRAAARASVSALLPAVKPLLPTSAPSSAIGAGPLAAPPASGAEALPSPPAAVSQAASPR